jgi:hypothetical protein
MEQVAIANLTPELSARASKQFRAVVTLLWPYSSLEGQFSLLLGDLDFRCRRKNGQVRAIFLGSSAKAVASTGVSINDEVVLSLHGAEFVQGRSANTPGNNIGWELSYTQTVSAQVIRNGRKIATLDLDDTALMPAPPSPTCRPLSAAPNTQEQWSFPAFVQRPWLPVFEYSYDPPDNANDGYNLIRQQKSYRDRSVYTYLARAPSPESVLDTSQGWHV